MTFQVGDMVKVRSWPGTYRVSSLLTHLPLAYIREVDGDGKGYIELRALVPVDEQAPAKVGAQLTIFT
jgi:hypothetical protein